jgi:hypothetical protein
MKKSSVAVVGFWLASVLAASAGVIVSDTWPNPSLDGWAITNQNVGSPPYGSIANAGAGSDYLRVTGGADPEGSIYADYIGDTDTLVGDYINGFATRVWAIQFNFLAQGSGTNVLPYGLSVYFMSSTNYWYYDITTVAAGWGVYGANLILSQGWYPSSGSRNTETLFNQDLLNVDEVGILLTYNQNGGGQVYGLDDFQLLDTPVPEPETYAVLGFALLSLGITFRGQLKRRIFLLSTAGRS